MFVFHMPAITFKQRYVRFALTKNEASRDGRDGAMIMEEHVLWPQTVPGSLFS